MASDPAPASPTAVPQRAPLAGTRAQSVHRLQVGLIGLAAMILLVGLANIIMTNARKNQAEVVPQAAATVAPASSAGNDPLADAGVVPDMPASGKTTARSNGRAGNAP